MTPLRWTEQAADDLAAIRAFVARDSAAYAHVVAERLHSAVGYLREFPDLGRIVPERAQPELRELIRQRYRISRWLTKCCARRLPCCTTLIVSPHRRSIND